ncbi:tail assembly protein [Vitreoscilla massiliensis]|uniref:Tail assembly protein n=1 Tax=Vitreoscilla massiliensis TaxID=1689272 RepID=A0ABY4E074_9NEIS|nr:tail assembly protein [Vitreoscilla massiliensis]UOO89140.1 tail assembly protein [Vitreoscilla massiliensis]
MITVNFYGDLSKFGRRFSLYAATPAEALRALMLQIDGLRDHIAAGMYQVRFQKQDMNEASLKDDMNQTGGGVLHIVPRVTGAGKWGQVIAGAVLIVAGYFITGLSYGWAAPVGGFMVKMGFAMVVGGVAQLLTKTPNMDANQDRGEKASRNTSFSNVDNTVAQGSPVPLLYGTGYVGSRVISQGIESRRVDTQNDPVMVDPEAVDVSLDIQKVFIQGQAAKAPNGVYYNTDFTDDSVIARNYNAKLMKV